MTRSTNDSPPQPPAPLKRYTHRHHVQKFNHPGLFREEFNRRNRDEIKYHYIKLDQLSTNPEYRATDQNPTSNVQYERMETHYNSKLCYKEAQTNVYRLCPYCDPFLNMSPLRENNRCTIIRNGDRLSYNAHLPFFYDSLHHEYQRHLATHHGLLPGDLEIVPPFAGLLNTEGPTRFDAETINFDEYVVLCPYRDDHQHDGPCFAKFKLDLGAGNPYEEYYEHVYYYHYNKIGTRIDLPSHIAKFERYDFVKVFYPFNLENFFETLYALEKECGTFNKGLKLPLNQGTILKVLEQVHGGYCVGAMDKYRLEAVVFNGLSPKSALRKMTRGIKSMCYLFDPDSEFDYFTQGYYSKRTRRFPQHFASIGSTKFSLPSVTPDGYAIANIYDRNDNEHDEYDDDDQYESDSDITSDRSSEDDNSLHSVNSRTNSQQAPTAELTRNNAIRRLDPLSRPSSLHRSGAIYKSRQSLHEDGTSYTETIVPGNDHDDHYSYEGDDYNHSDSDDTLSPNSVLNIGPGEEAYPGQREDHDGTEEAYEEIERRQQLHIADILGILGTQPAEENDLAQSEHLYLNSHPDEDADEFVRRFNQDLEDDQVDTTDNNSELDLGPVEHETEYNFVLRLNNELNLGIDLGPQPEPEPQLEVPRRERLFRRDLDRLYEENGVESSVAQGSNSNNEEEPDEEEPNEEDQYMDPEAQSPYQISMERNFNRMLSTRRASIAAEIKQYLRHFEIPRSTIRLFESIYKKVLRDRGESNWRKGLYGALDLPEIRYSNKRTIPLPSSFKSENFFPQHIRKIDVRTSRKDDTFGMFLRAGPDILERIRRRNCHESVPFGQGGTGNRLMGLRRDDNEQEHERERRR